MADGDPTPVLEVLDGGLLATIQDLGRPGHVQEGVPRSGAADGLSLAIANALAGNPAGAAALEITVEGLRLRALRPVTVALGGADLGAAVEPGPGSDEQPRRLLPGERHELLAGDELVFEGRPADALGCRAYLALPGGVDVPEVLGSRSTSLVGAFGGFEGRALRAGDRLSASGSVAKPPPDRRPDGPPARLPAGLSLPSPAQRVRILAIAGDEHARSAAERLAAQAWVVSGDSDRRGLRLMPASGRASLEPRDRDRATADRPSEAVIPGAIQVTPSGQPLVLLPDAGTTGGYAVAAVVIAADLPILGQLAPWDEVRFRLVDLTIAAGASRDRQRLLDDIAAALQSPRHPG